MSKYPIFKYEFEMFDKSHLLEMGGKFVDEDGDTLKVERYDSAKRILWVSINRKWYALYPSDFKRWKMTYPAYVGKTGFKWKEQY